MPGQPGLHTDPSQGPLITIKRISYSPELILVLNHLLMQYFASHFHGLYSKMPRNCPQTVSSTEPHMDYEFFSCDLQFSHVVPELIWPFVFYVLLSSFA